MPNWLTFDQYSQMAPRDSRDAREANGNRSPMEKGKGKRNISQSSSIDSLANLTPESLSEGITITRQMSKYLTFVQSYREDIDKVEKIYSIGLRQEDRIKELEATVACLNFQKDKEMIRLSHENDTCRDNAQKLKLEREKLEQDQASMSDRHEAMQSDMEKKRDKEIAKAKKEISEKSEASVKQVKEDFKKRIHDLETGKQELKDVNKMLEERITQTQNDLKKQIDTLELEKRSSQLHIKHLESQLQQINAASTVSMQTPDY